MHYHNLLKFMLRGNDTIQPESHCNGWPWGVYK